MKLTNRSEYALLALVYLSRQKQGILVGGDQIAAAQDIPKKFLQQILYSLKNSRIIRSGKGQAGGYALAKKPRQISLAEVIRLFEGPLAPSKSASKYFYEPSPIERERKLLALMKEVRTMVSHKLENTTLADML